MILWMVAIAAALESAASALIAYLRGDEVAALVWELTLVALAVTLWSLESVKRYVGE